MPTQGIVWKRSPSDLAADLERMYYPRAVAAVAALLRYFEPQLEEYAKQHHPWQDQTSNATQGLFAVTELAEKVVTLYLSHGMEYGKWLELCNQGRYAIILPTLQSHYRPVMDALRELFR